MNDYYEEKIIRLKKYISAIREVLQENYGFSEKDIIELAYAVDRKLKEI